MHRAAYRAAILVLAIAAFASTARAVTYTATLLHPADFDFSAANGNSDANQVGYGFGPPTNHDPHALLWTSTTRIDLHPAGYLGSYATAVSGNTQVGYGAPSTNSLHALMWSGSPSAIDLNPSGYTTSYAFDVSNTGQVGYGYGAATSNNSHALLWTGSAASKVDLHPTGFTESFAKGIAGTLQVGHGYGATTGFNQHALLWNGTAASATDLNPPGFTESYAAGISGTTKVGYGSGTATGGNIHALSWNGTSNTLVDLNPAGFQFSEAIGVSSAGQVGDGFSPATGGNSHALYWNGTATSAIDLHGLLAGLGPTFDSSIAKSISDNGVIVGYALELIPDAEPKSYAVLWTPLADTGVPADYNNNTRVDAADYVQWRKGGPLLYNEVTTIGSATTDDYFAWREHFGNGPTNIIAFDSARVPEPSSITLLLIGAALAYHLHRKRLTAFKITVRVREQGFICSNRRPQV